MTHHVLKLLRISHVLARYDVLILFRQIGIAPSLCRLFGFYPFRCRKGQPGARLALALQALGPAFIKLGQALSTRPDLIGQDIADDLAQLQDRLPPFSFAKVRRAIEEEFGKPPEEIFKTFEQQPVAAASIAQVHFATDHAGKELAVKILRPGIEKAFAEDIALFYWLAEVIERSNPKLKRLRLSEVVQTLEQTVLREMDMRMEAAAAQQLRENFAGDSDLIIPEIDWKRTTRRVLTLERISGTRISEVAALRDAGHDMDVLIARAGRIFFKQVYRDGFFHADMHPGNLFVAEDGRMILVDFGIMGRLDWQTRIFLAEMLHGFLKRDYRIVAEVHFAAGYVPADQSVEDFALACRSIAEPIFGLPQNEISIARLLQQLFRITETFQMETQPQLLLLQKNMMLAEGIGRMLNPNVNIWKLAGPLIEDWYNQHFSPTGRLKREAGERLAHFDANIRGLLTAAGNLPNVLTPEGLKIHPDTLKSLTTHTSTNTLFRWWHVALLSASIAAVVTWLLTV